MSESVQRPPRRWPFYVSLFLNGVLVATLAFGLIAIKRFRDRAETMGAWMPRQIERVLPEGSRGKVEAIREKHRDEFRPLFRATRDAREALAKALETEPFDAEAARAAFAKVREADAALAQATSEVMVEIASALTPEERKLVRDAARRHGPRGRGKGGPMGPPPGPDGALPPPMDMPLPPPDGMEPPPPPDGAEPPPPPPPL